MNRKIVRDYDLFISCSPGLEPLVQEELTQLGFDRSDLGHRGVYLYCDDLFDAIYRINYASRLATRVLLPLASFRCKDPEDLYRNASRIEWEGYIPLGKTFAIDANVTHDTLRNSLYAAQLVKDALCDRLKELYNERPSVDLTNPNVQLNLFIYNGQATISFDTSREALHKRGYRLVGGDAPLQEVLAAAILQIARWRGETPLYDLFCGTGTFLTEAALIASNTAPAFLRSSFGFMLLPGFSRSAWLKVKAEIDAKRCVLPKNLLFGVDIEEKAVKATKANLRACGFMDKVTLHHGSFEDFTPASPPKFVVANPPHGGRLGTTESLMPLYQSLGRWLKNQVDRPAKAFVLLSDLELAKELSLGAGKKQRFVTGGETKYLCEYEFN
jgi:putative N6-adenine-specific DNA methylase